MWDEGERFQFKKRICTEAYGEDVLVEFFWGPKVYDSYDDTLII